jgi:acyl-CoA thioester hydrolase
MEKFPFEVPLEVRFRDLDPMGHVNNAVYASYFENGRVAFFRERFGVKGATDFPFILARLEIDYRRPVMIGDELVLGMRVTAMGATSFSFEYRLTANGAVAAEGRSVQVAFDYDRGTKRPLDPDFRSHLEPYLAGDDVTC